MSMIPHAWSNKTALKFGDIPNTLINPPPVPVITKTYPNEWKWIGLCFLIAFIFVYSQYLKPVVQKVFGKDSQQSSLFALVYFILVFLFWWHYFYDATFQKDGDQVESLFVPSFAEIVETVGDYVGPTGVLGLVLLAGFAKHQLKIV